MKPIVSLRIIASAITLLSISQLALSLTPGSQIKQDDLKLGQTTRQNATQSSGAASEQQGRSLDVAPSKSTRGGRMLDLDHMAGDIGKNEKVARDQSLSGQRQSRILNDDLDFTAKDAKLDGRSKGKKAKGKKKMAISGFIPIVSLEGAKEGKHFEAEEEEQDDEHEDGAVEQQQQHPDVASSIKNQLMSNYGGQTSMGHASFGIQPEPNEQQISLQQQQQQQQWQQVPAVTYSDQQQADTGRARKLLGATGLLSNLANLPKKPFLQSQYGQAGPQNMQPYQQIQGPMNVPPMTTLVGSSPADSDADCICVPFFQCKSGYLSESQLSKSQLQQIVGHVPAMTLSGGNQFQIPRSLAPTGQLSALDLTSTQNQQPQISSLMSQVNQQASYHPGNKPNDQQMVNDIYDQLRKNIERDNLEQQLQLQAQSAYTTVDERSKSGASQTENSTAPQQAESDLFERSLLNPLIGRRSASQQRCGIMRTCCKIPASLSQHVPTSHHQHEPAFRPQQAHRHNPRAETPSHMMQASRPQYQILQVQRQQHHHQQQPLSHQQLVPSHPQLQPTIMDEQPDFSALQATFQQQQQQPQLQHQFVGSQMDSPPQQRPVGSFMAGRCGTRQTIGISGRVQNAQPAPGSETTAEFGEFPSHVAILKRISPGDSLFVCSAVLISNQWIATAAHCVRKHRPDELKVRLGEWDVNRDDEFYPFVESTVREIILHPDFQPTSLINDLALLRLSTQIDQQQMPHISPACLSAPDELFSQQRCWVTGWGKDAFGQGGSFQSVLKKVDLPVVGRQECEMALRFQTKLGKFFRLHPSALCAGGERGKDACEGDGGAGLYCTDPESGLTKVAGLVSWGVGCGQRGVPGVYTNLANFYRWIEQVVAASGEESLYLGGNGLADGAFKNLISERSNAGLNGTVTGDYLTSNSTTVTPPVQQQELARNSDSKPSADDSDANKELESRAG